MSDKPVIFISYSHKDEPAKPAEGEVQWLTYVKSHLGPTVKHGLIQTWDDQRILGGDTLDDEISQSLNDCDICILLVSRHSLASNYIIDTEMKRMLERRQREGVRIYPIILSPCMLEAAEWLPKINLRPKDAKPLSTMNRSDRDEAMTEIVREIVKILRSQQTSPREGNKPNAPSVVDYGRLPETPYEKLVGRDAELKRLDDAWADDKTNILSLVAWGGAGKTSLVNEWLVKLQQDDYRGAESVLGWSFYSQGTKERATSSEVFLDWALGKLGVTVGAQSGVVKAEKLAETLGKRRILLVLDGVEPLQHGPGEQEGQLKDQGLRTFLRRFATVPSASAHALVVITSRLAIRDIEQYRRTANNSGSSYVIDLSKLSDKAGAALLADSGVKGSESELDEAAQDFDGNPLALSLLASLLARRYQGDIRQRSRIEGLLGGSDARGQDQAQRVMQAYEQDWLKDEPVLTAVMHLVSVFDVAASASALRALRANPPIEGLTDQFSNTTDDAWADAVASLRDVRLLAPVNSASPESVTTHPLVRLWFRQKLRQKTDRAYHAARYRLSEYMFASGEDADTSSSSSANYAADYASDMAETTADALGVRADVEALAQLICLSTIKPPLSIALFGPWGSGKTTFMERLLGKIDELTGLQRNRNKSARTHSSEPFVGHVAQIRFNAWHYSDANLWACLTAEFFEQLRDGGAVAKRKAMYGRLVGKVADRVRGLEADVKRAQAESSVLVEEVQRKEREIASLTGQLISVELTLFEKHAAFALKEVFEQEKGKLKELGERLGKKDLDRDLEGFIAIVREASEFRKKVQLIARVVFSWGWPSGLAIISLLMLLGFGIGFRYVGSGWVDAIASYAPLALSVLSAAGSVTLAYTYVKPILDGLSAYAADIEAEKKTIAAKLKGKTAELSAARSEEEKAREREEVVRAKMAPYGGPDRGPSQASIMRYFLFEDNDTRQYEQQLGIVSRARRSFEMLDAIVRKTYDAREAAQRIEQLEQRSNALSQEEKERLDADKKMLADADAYLAVPDRIVLYIDDLDRCSYDQVYDVLQAVHLLLAFELFVVIVGVDVRWIEGAIANRFEADLHAGKTTRVSISATSNLPFQRRARSLEYLEKIFQIPFWLRPLGTTEGGTYGRFVEHLLSANKPVPIVGKTPSESNETFDNSGKSNASNNDLGNPIGTEAAIPEKFSATGTDGQSAIATAGLSGALERLTLTEAEYKLLRSPEIGALVGKSPRAVKRFLNTYRIIRARRRGARLARFIGVNEEPPLFPAVVILLAIDVGQLSNSASSFRRFFSVSEKTTFDEAVNVSETLSGESWFANSFGIKALDAAIAVAREQGLGKISIYDLVALSEESQRYSFNDPRELPTDEGGHSAGLTSPH